MMLMIKSRHISHFDLQLGAKPHPPKFLSSSLPLLNLKEKQSFPSLTRFPRLPKYDKKQTRDFAFYGGVEPAGVPPSGPPYILSWITGLAIAVVVPLISYKCGPTLKNKILAALNMTEEIVEAVEKAADEVEKVAEDVSDKLPATGELRKAVDFVEHMAERVAKDAGAVDDFIDKVQEEEEKAESLVETVKDEMHKKSNGDDAKDDNFKENS